MLSQKYVDRIFARLLVRYGIQWIRMWDGIDEAAVKSDWAQVLDNIPEFRLRHALDNLPSDRPPNAAQFRALCIGAREVAAPPRLSAPALNPQRVVELVARIDRGPKDPLAGARAMRNRELAGERLSIPQREFWRIALRREIETGVLA